MKTKEQLEHEYRTALYEISQFKGLLCTDSQIWLEKTLRDLQKFPNISSNCDDGYATACRDVICYTLQPCGKPPMARKIGFLVSQLLLKHNPGFITRYTEENDGAIC